MNNLTFRVAGVTYDNRQQLIRRILLDASIRQDIASGDFLTLTPEPDNPHDPNAIKVVHASGQLGYVPRDQCAAVAGLLARPDVQAHIKEITGGTADYPTFGVSVYVGVPMPSYLTYRERAVEVVDDYDISEQAFDDVLREDIFDDFDPYGHSEGHDLIDTFGDR